MITDCFATEINRIQKYAPELMPEDWRSILSNLPVHGDFSRWMACVQAISVEDVGALSLNNGAVGASVIFHDKHAFIETLEALMPWRKGPFYFADVHLDAEWRSDYKYQRLIQAGLDVRDKTVLDVGTGNGYFLYRYLLDGARFALGVDPSWHAFAQYALLQKIYPQAQMAYLPATLDSIQPRNADIALAMGVLYHRRDPKAFLHDLIQTVRQDGLIVVETLAIEGQGLYQPKEGKYLGMRNVWQLPSLDALSCWLQELGCRVEYISDLSLTTDKEQRQTQWMRSYSLNEFLLQSPETAPPPLRGFVFARKGA